MNLLTDDWLPVRPLQGGPPGWITLGELLTGGKQYEICLPRDDLELAALQLVICITQVLFPPNDIKQLVERLRTPLTQQDYNLGIENFKQWFEMEHPEYPFMQVRGVKANKKTLMLRLLPGLADATNSCFVNEPNIAEFLCGGCSAIALFNRASNAPSFGGGNQGGFKPGLRGSIPITTLVQGRHLRETVWLNVLTKNSIPNNFEQSSESYSNEPTWVSNIVEKSTTEAHNVGLIRGLFWQPALIELGKSIEKGKCDLCGKNGEAVFNHFLTNQFGYTFETLWPHPHSPIWLNLTDQSIKTYFASFKNATPSWTQLAKFVVKREVDNINREGQEPAAVIRQAYELSSKNKEKIVLSIGGYCNEPGKTASISERRHEIFSLNKGWTNSPQFIEEIVQIGLGYKAALISALTLFENGMIDKKSKKKILKGLTSSNKKKKKKFFQIGETQFYRRTDHLMQKALAEAHFEDPEQLAADKADLRAALKQCCRQIFEEQTSPYLNDPELIRTMAVARRTLGKHIKDLEPKP